MGWRLGRQPVGYRCPKAGLGNRVRAARTGKLAEVGKGQRSPSELEMELARARRELVEVNMECDLLKTFAAYFANKSR